MVNGLEKHNLVVRIPGLNDKRQKLIYLTKLGKKQMEQMANFTEGLIKIVCQGIARKQVKSCLDVFQKVLINLENK